jgi:hypothetical protein
MFCFEIVLKLCVGSLIEEMIKALGLIPFLVIVIVLPKFSPDGIKHSRVARFFVEQNTKTGKIYQITTKYTKCP